MKIGLFYILFLLLSSCGYIDQQAKKSGIIDEEKTYEFCEADNDQAYLHSGMFFEGSCMARSGKCPGGFKKLIVEKEPEITKCIAVVGDGDGEGSDYNDAWSM